MTDVTAALVALAEANVKPDILEMLTMGSAREDIAPRALEKAIHAVDRARDAARRASCRHLNRYSNGSISSDGSSNMQWHCQECGASGESSTPAREAPAISVADLPR